MEELLWITGLHAVARSLYRLTGGRRRTKVHDAMMTFYRGLLPPNVSIFDIGANVGILSEIFLSLGARVLAVEPNADCVRHMQLSYADAQLETIQAVAGPKNGLASLSLSDERDDISSVSKDWIAAIKREHKEYEGLWSKQVTVPMVALDTLVQQYGLPYFIKIDVEGFEESVLSGLSMQSPLLSFEFNTAYLEPAIRCVDKQLFTSESVFNFVFGDPVGFELSSWVGKEQLKRVLNKMAKGEKYGEIFVRRPDLEGENPNDHV